MNDKYYTVRKDDAIELEIYRHHQIGYIVHYPAFGHDIFRVPYDCAEMIVFAVNPNQVAGFKEWARKTIKPFGEVDEHTGL